MFDDAEDVIDAHEVAQVLHLHIKSVYKYARDGVIPGAMIGRIWRFSRRDIKLWLHMQSQERINHGYEASRLRQSASRNSSKAGNQQGSSRSDFSGQDSPCIFGSEEEKPASESSQVAQSVRIPDINEGGDWSWLKA